MIINFFDKVLELYFEPFNKIGSTVKQNKALRQTLGVIFIILILSTVGLVIYSSYLTVKDHELSKFIINQVLPFFVVPLIFLAIILYMAIIKSTPTSTEKELARLENEKNELKNKIEAKNSIEIFYTIQLSLNQLNEYYTINKAQAKSSFRFSIFAIVIGLLTIVSGIWLFYLNESPNLSLTIMTGFAGMLLEFIGGAYFFMYKKSLEQVNFFFGQLIKIQDTMLSINLTKNIGNEDKQIELTEKIITSLLERSLK